MPDGPTTARARRQQAVAEGSAETAVDRLSGRSNPGGNGVETTSRERQRRTKQDIAEELDISREGVGSVDRLEGLDVFLRSPGVDEFDQQLREQAAQDEQFIEPADLGTEIDPQGLSGRVTGVRQPRRDNVAARRIEANSPYQTLTEDDVTKRSEGGFGVTETKQRSFTASEIASDTALETVDPQADLQPTDGGFGLNLGAERRLVAESTEQSTPLSSVDPQSDVTVVDGEPQLTDRTRKEAGAAQLDEQYPDLNIGVGDVQLEDGQVTFEKEVRR